MSVKGFLIGGSIEKYDYNSLDNLPGNTGGGLSEAAKAALLACFSNVAWIGTDGQSYYDSLAEALNPTATLTAITAAFNQGGAVIYNTDSIESLRNYLTVTAHYADGTSEVVSNYTLSGALTTGLSVITATYEGETDTFTVQVTAEIGTYSITNMLTNCTTSNSATSISVDSPYSATITPDVGYTLTGATVSILMGGNDVRGFYQSGTISIPSVTGDLVITVRAAQEAAPDTTAVIAQENVCWSKTVPNTVTKAGFGVTQWYGYEFTQETLEACQYWDTENGYMTTSGWAGIKICTPDYLTYAAGYSWPASANYKHALGKDEVYTNYFTFTRNAVSSMQLQRQSLSQVAANGMSASLPLLDIDYAYAYWYKPLTGSIFPTGVTNGDIIFAGKYTPYYGLSNINEAPDLSSISAAFTQGETVVTASTALNDLKPMLSVTASYDDGSTMPVNLGLVTLSGTLAEGTSTITATYNSKTATFNVTVTGA